MNKTHMSELNDGKGADVDSDIVPLVKFINKLGFETTASAAGGFARAYVKFAGTKHLELDEFLFDQIGPMVAHLGDKVELTLTCIGGSYEGSILMHPSVLEEVTKRLGCWTEMLHK